VRFRQFCPRLDRMKNLLIPYIPSHLADVLCKLMENFLERDVNRDDTLVGVGGEIKSTIAGHSSVSFSGEPFLRFKLEFFNDRCLTHCSGSRRKYGFPETFL